MALHSACDDQDRVFGAAFSIISDAIEHRVFPAASLAVTSHNKLVARKSLGRFLYEDPPRNRKQLSNLAVSPDTLFDLASVTKVVATTTMAMILYERGQLDLEAPIAAVIPEFLRDANCDLRRRDVTFRMLLAHTSGLPAYERLFLRAQKREGLLTAAFSTPLTADPGSRAEYSDIGFIILGEALERIAQERLDNFSQREIFGPLGMTHTTFNPPADLRCKIPPTANDSSFRKRVVQGEVQDENAWALGGVAGHAGLFASVRDVALFAQAMLHGESSIIKNETVELFTRRESAPAGTSRALGWDTPSQPSQSGKYFGPRTYGHLGYTGTSVWIDPDRQLSITFLTTRTWPDCQNQAIKQIRPRVHDAVIEAIQCHGHSARP